MQENYCLFVKVTDLHQKLESDMNPCGTSFCQKEKQLIHLRPDVKIKTSEEWTREQTRDGELTPFFMKAGGSPST
jgi:hypothetical protein